MYRHRIIPFVAVLAIVAGYSVDSYAQRAQQATFGNLIAALNNINVQVQRVHILENVNVEDVQVINIGDIDIRNIRVLNNALNRNVVQILNLRNVLNNLDLDLDVNIGQVVAVDVLSGGDIIIFVDDLGLM